MSTTDPELSRPVFVKNFEATRFQQGNDAQFRAVVTGNPLPEVIWSKKGQNLPYSDKYQYTYDSQSGHITLLIKDIGPGDEGQYSCTASNDYGSVTATLNLNPDVNSAGNSNAYKHEKPLSCFNSNTLRATLERNKKKNSTSPSIYSNGDMTL